MALGIDISTAQKDVLANGGEVLVAQGLPEPGCYSSYGDFAPTFDSHDDPVYVASGLVSYPIDMICPTSFSRPAGCASVGDLLDREVDDGWSYWPSYTGEYDAELLCQAWWFNEEGLFVHRVWDGIPISEIGEDMAAKIVGACDDRVDSSPYTTVGGLLEYFECNGLIEVESEEDEANLDDEDGEVYNTMKLLAEDGIWDLNTQWFTGRAMEFESMEVILGDDREALMVWNTLLAMGKTYTARARKSVRADNRYRYDYSERNFSPW